MSQFLIAQQVAALRNVMLQFGNMPRNPAMNDEEAALDRATKIIDGLREQGCVIQPQHIVERVRRLSAMVDQYRDAAVDFIETGATDRLSRVVYADSVRRRLEQDPPQSKQP